MELLLLREVDKTQLFLDGMTFARDRLALTMILHGKFPSQGWRIAEGVWRDGDVLRYACFPLAPI